MANKWAIQNGNWSDGSTWNDGVVPTADDDVWLNGYTVSFSSNGQSIYAHSISNSSNVDISAVAGGKIYCDYDLCIVNSNIYGKSTKIVDVTLNSNVFTINGDCIIDADTANEIILCVNGWSVAHYFYINGDVTEIEGSVGYLIASSTNYRPNCIINGGTLTTYRQLRYSCVANFTLNCDYEVFGGEYYQGVVNGNLFVKGGASATGFTTITGNVYNDKGYAGANEVLGNWYIGSECLGQTQPYIVYGSVIVDVDFHNTYLFNNTAKIIYNGIINNSENSRIASNVSSLLTLGGETHLGNLYSVGNNTYTMLTQLRILTGGKIYYKSYKFQFPFAWEYIIDNPSTFDLIYEGEGQPQFDIFPYEGNTRLNYPTEQQVAQGVTYGMQNEYEGRLALPQPSTVLKGVEYGGDKVGTLEVIALSGATATADNISVVNLTEQEVNRVKNCATVSTVQKCFEDFKE